MSACAHCQTSLCADHVVAGQPFITARQLTAVMLRTLVNTPALLGEILFKELDLVEYCAPCRAALAPRRQTEQLKLLAGIVVMFVLIAGLATATVWMA